MRPDLKFLIQFYDEKARPFGQYEQLEKDNAALRAQVEALKRQVDLLLRRQVFFDAPFETPTRH